MKQALRERLNISKVSRYAVVANAAQMLFALGLFAYALFGSDFHLTGTAEQVLVGAMSMIVIWGAVLDIRDAHSARKIAAQREMLSEAYVQLEDLNGTLRAQRHDFMNHLQVVFGLLEMEEYAEAQDYIERVYGDIQRVGRSLKTASPAVNALLAAKMADCEGSGIDVEVAIRSAWQGLPVPGWEMCRILGNLIDNAVDALEELSDARRKLLVEIGEDLHDYTFSVSNTGPEIPEHVRASIFERGFTTKRAGRGLGLSIVRDVLDQHGGTIEVRSGGGSTAFVGRIPKGTPARKAE